MDFESAMSQLHESPPTAATIVADVLPWLLPIVIVLAVILPFLVSFSRFRRRHGRKKQCTAPAIGFITSIQQTGLYVNENPQLLISLNALDENGKMFQTAIQQIVPLSQLSQFGPSVALKLRYDPANPAFAISDPSLDAGLAQDIMDRYQCARHPASLSLEERREIRANGVLRKALVENIRLTGKEEGGDVEAEVTMRFPGDEAEDLVFRRTMYLSDQQLDQLIIGRYVTVQAVPGREHLFAFAFPVSTYTIPS